MSSTVIFSVFADLHYKKGMYAAGVGDIESIFERAEREGSELVLHLGDLCNDYLRSPELINAYLYNKQGIEAYGIYGNHELETIGNTMSLVTPSLTNRSDRVIWGSDSGKIEDGSIAYYYFDKYDFRFICLDANYSLNPITHQYEHNLPASWGAPSGNLYPCSLGKLQLEWLYKTVISAANGGKHCIIASHPSFSGLWQECNDAVRVREIFKEANDIKKGSVLLALNGHIHTNHSAVIEDVLYLDIGAVRSGWWSPAKFDPYREADIKNPRYTFEFADYDQGGTPSATFLRPLSSLTMGAQTLFYTKPLSATVTVCDDGSISVAGSETEWMYGIKPDSEIQCDLLKINDLKIDKK